ncbi:MAG: hypothetical protein H0T75_01195 [Rhizobiales bacterium]|nr:hypothetical protein [Hyphomicrobiales bacterium]MDQ3559187.1 hypothetical protein [Pseudomonadota bacterium]
MRELVIRLDPQTAERLSRVSIPGRESAEEIALEAILERLDELESAPVAIKRLQDIQDGLVQTLPHDQAMRDIGLED